MALVMTVAHGQPGSLDPSFGIGGITTIDIDWNDWGQALAIRPDGRILQSGTAFSDTSAIILIQYLPDGSLDQAFGINGRVSIGGADVVQGGGVAVLDDGRAYACGGMGPFSDPDMVLIRVQPNGDLDASFGSGGMATADAFGGEDLAMAIEVQSDGKVLLAGTSFDGLGYRFTLVRFNEDGTLDPSFGAGGVAMAFQANSQARCIALQSDGRIVVAGNTPGTPGADVAVARFNSNGTLDVSFGSGGTVVSAVGPVSQAAYGVALQPDGKILVTGHVSYGFDMGTDMMVLRYDAQGTLDPDFGIDGIALIDLSADDEQVFDLVVQPDGRIVIAGRSEQGGSAISLARLDADGQLDATFGSNGVVIFPMTSSTEAAYAVAMDAQGRIVIGGTSADDLIVARLFSGLEVGLPERAHSILKGSIHPLPATDVAYLELSIPLGASYSVELCDPQGRTVRSVTSGQVFRGGDGTIPIELADLPTGCYSVLVTVAGQKFRLPLVKV